MKCQNCGSNEIESDSTRADSVCTKCGTVCESGIIVSDVQFEENAHGGTSALGTFVASDRKGGTFCGQAGYHGTSVGRRLLLWLSSSDFDLTILTWPSISSSWLWPNI